MDKHLICLDLDGTLLTDEKVIGSYTKKVLLELKKKGHELVISTGRPYRASEIYYRELGIETPVVNFNGAFVHHPHDFNFNTFHEELDLDVAREIANRAEDLNIQNIIAEVKDSVFLHYHDGRLFDAFSMGEPEIRVGELTQTMTAGPTSILIQAEESEMEGIRKELDDLFAEVIEHRRWGAPYPVLEIVKKGINKAVGVEHVREYLNIGIDNTIAFGDEDNDTEMLQYVAHGVAMKNAIDDIQNIADHVTRSNNDDGIGHFLNDYFNLNIKE